MNTDDRIRTGEAAEAWIFAIGNLPKRFTKRTIKLMAKKALALARKQPGFVGIHPQPPHGTLLIYRTENDAKRAKNNLEFEGVVCGKGIAKVFIDKRYVEEAR